MEGAETGKMTAEPSVRHVLSSWEGVYFRSVLSASHATRYREIVTRPSETLVLRVRAFGQELGGLAAMRDYGR